MKNLFYLAALAALCAACSNNEIMETAPPASKKAIEMSGSFVNKPTRGPLLTKDLTKFAVWAWQREGNQNKSFVVFHQEVVRKTNDQWTYNNLQYWIPNRRYTFFALSSTYNEASIERLNFTPPEAVLYWSNITFNYSMGGARAFTDDLVYATQLRVTGGDVSQEAPVDLTFNHVFAQVAFTIHDNTPEGKTISISNVNYTGNKMGTCTLKQSQDDKTAPAVDWTSFSGTEMITPRAYSRANRDFSDNKLWTTFEVSSEKPCIPLFVIPASSNANAWNGALSFQASLHDGDNSTADVILSKTITGNINHNFEPGHSYHVQLYMDITDMTSDKPIVFTVTEVNPFGDWEDVPITVQ